MPLALKIKRLKGIIDLRLHHNGTLWQRFSSLVSVTTRHLFRDEPLRLPSRMSSAASHSV